MTLRAKIIVAQTPLFAAVILLSVLAVVTVSKLGAVSQTILKDNYRSVLAAQRIKDMAERIDDAATRFLVLGNRAEGARLAQAPFNRFEAELQAEEGNITEP